MEDVNGERLDDLHGCAALLGSQRFDPTAGNRVRRFVAFCTIVAMLAAGLVPPHRVMAASHPGVSAAGASHVEHTKAHTNRHDAMSHAHHGNAGVDAHHGDDQAAPNHDAAGLPVGSAAPDNACCAAACAPIALIFVQLILPAPLRSRDFAMPSTWALTPATPHLIDRPPRAS